MTPEYLDRPAGPETIRAWKDADVPREGLVRALDIASENPPVEDWQAAISRLSLALGAALLTSALVFFFAYNWASLGRLTKLLLVSAALLGASVVAYRRHGNDDAIGRVSLAVATFLVGPLFGIYGQAYQTGADTYGLFATWAVLALPFALSSTKPEPWVIVVGVADFALWLFWDTHIYFGDEQWRWLLFVYAALHGTAFLLAEWLGSSSSWRWASRLFVSVGMFSLVITACSTFFDDYARAPGLVGILALAMACAGLLWSYSRHQRDLFFPALVSASVISVLTVAVGKALLGKGGGNDVSSLFLVGLFLIAEIGGAATWLRSLARKGHRA